LQKFKHHCIIDEITYDHSALINLFNQFPDECHLPWNKYKAAIKGERHSHQPRGDGGLNGIFSPYWEGKQMWDYEPVKQVLSCFNFVNPLDEHDITFMTYTPGFTFANHTDRYLEYNIMFPLVPDDGGEPITFYKGEDKDRDNPLGVEYTYHYNTTHPTVFNGKTIHSVDTIQEYRVMFRIKVTSETYGDMLARYEAGEFINE
jgi:hypothetical protein